MTIEVGEPVHLGFQPADGGEAGEIYQVGASKRSPSGRLLATGTVIVVVPNDQGHTEAVMKDLAKRKALAMIAIDPGLLTPVRIAAPGHTHPERDDEGTPPWDGDGIPDAPEDDPNPDEPKRILSPDSPQTGR